MGEALSYLGISLLLLALTLSILQMQQPQYTTKLEAAINKDTSGELVQVEENPIGSLEDEEMNTIGVLAVVVKQKRPVKGLAISINNARVYVDFAEIRDVIKTLEKMRGHVGSEVPDKFMFATKSGFRLELSAGTDGSAAFASIDGASHFLLNGVEQIKQLGMLFEAAHGYLK